MGEFDYYAVVDYTAVLWQKEASDKNEIFEVWPFLVYVGCLLSSEHISYLELRLVSLGEHWQKEASDNRLWISYGRQK